MYTDILEYYKQRLITQYRNKSKARDTIGVFTDCSVCEGLPLQLRDTFILDSAYGKQLDIIGRIVGVERNVIGFSPLYDFFSFTTYASVDSIGFGRYAWPYDPGTNYIFMRYRNQISYTMTDFDIRAAIKLAIIYNNNYETYYKIKQALYYFFGDDIDVGPGASNMTIAYTVANLYKNSFLVMEYFKLLPVPMGCSMSAVYV
jgi:hypothetical protein